MSANIHSNQHNNRVLSSIKLHRLVLAFAITFLIADTYPHPSLSAGLLQTHWQHLQQTLR